MTFNTGLQQNPNIQNQESNMIWFTDAKNKKKIAINPQHVVAVFVADVELTVPNVQV